MKHGEVRVRLGPYLEGDLPLQQRALVDAHLDACPSCAEELRELRGTIGLLRSLPEVEPPAGLANSVIARIQAGEAQPTLRVRLLDGLDMLLRSRPLALSAAAVGVIALALLAPGWLAEQVKAPQTTALTTPASDAIARRLAPLDVWMQQTPFVRRPMGSSVPNEEAATPVAPGPEPLPVGSELGAMEAQLEQIRRDPSGFLDELSGMPLAERDEQLSALLDEVIRAGRTAEIVQILRTTGDRRAEAILDRLELTSSSASPP
ncbi:MAG TPA: zf-HC2 domain-containing protein [Myxococcota bacterium]|nr:zf-HC2 domain-containing protein [Myxococcota bacterium]